MNRLVRDRARVRRRTRRYQLFAAVFALLFLAGCGDDSPPRPGAAPDVSGVWMGPWFTTTADSGMAVLELVQDGTDLEGDITFRRRDAANGDVAHYLRGFVHDNRITIAADGGTIPLPYEFNLAAEVTGFNHIEGTFSHSAAGLTADFTFEKLPRGSAVVDTSVWLNAGVKAMAFDGEALWLSSTDGYYLVGTLASEHLQSVAVYLYPGILWTGSALASDGTHIWGDYPVTVQHGDALTNISDLIQFNRQGVIERRDSLPHRTSGLAYDGQMLWCLGGTGTLYRLGAPGEVTDSLVTGLPDLIHLEYAMGHFWSVGWFIRKLYEIDRSGRVVAVYDLPRGPGWDFPAGLAFDGSRFYYASGDVPSSTTVYRFTPRSLP